jgi:3-dehydroquinate dehydratase / shikimate dehydrogenase
MTKPSLCVTVSAATMAELRRRRDAVEDADLIELRLDSVSEPSVAGALDGRKRPVIVTCRPEWEGGGFEGSEEDRRQILADALTAGAEYVDIEWAAHFDDLIERTGGRRIVLSSHDFQGVPGDLHARFHAMRATGAEVVKIAAATTCLSDCLPLLDLGAQAGPDAGVILIGMGDCGLATRVLAGRFGSRWTYAGALSHLGQLDAATLLRRYRFRTIDSETQIYGLVGFPIGHSVSPAMHNAAFAQAGVNAVYLPFPAPSAADFARFGTALGIRGASVTVPHKVALCDHVVETDAVARRVGAINTITVQDGRWIGGNTDASGFLAPLTGVVPLRTTRAAVLGAGGAARAVADALTSRGAAVSIHARRRSRAEEVASLTAAAPAAVPGPKRWRR